MPTTKTSTTNPRPFGVSASLRPIPQPAKAPQITPRHRKMQNEPTAPHPKSSVRNKPTCHKHSRPHLTDNRRLSPSRAPNPANAPQPSAPAQNEPTARSLPG